MSDEVALRPATDLDREFLARLYAGTRDDLAAVPLPEPQRAALVAQQFAAQTAEYAHTYPDAEVSVVLVGGESGGRLIVDRSGESLRVVDITLLPGHRGRGIGTQLLSLLLVEADDAGATVSLSVLRANPALRLYERLGFRVVAEDGPYLGLERQAKIAS